MRSRTWKHSFRLDGDAGQQCYLPSASGKRFEGKGLIGGFRHAVSAAVDQDKTLLRGRGLNGLQEPGRLPFRGLDFHL